MLYKEETIIQCWSLLGNAKLVNLLVEHLGLDWKCAYRIEQAALVSIPPHALTSPSFILNMFLFLYSCFRFPITLTFASNRIKTYIEKAVIISEKWSSLNHSRKVCLHLQYIQTFRTHVGSTARFSIICIYNDYAWWWVLKISIKKEFASFTCCPILCILYSLLCIYVVV